MVFRAEAVCHSLHNGLICRIAFGLDLVFDFGEDAVFGAHTVVSREGAPGVLECGVKAWLGAGGDLRGCDLSFSNRSEARHNCERDGEEGEIAFEREVHDSVCLLV